MTKVDTVAYGSTYTSDLVAYENVCAALTAGYHIFNTCAAYGNEKGMGRAFRSIPREKIKIISLDSNELRSSENAERFDGYAATMRQITASMENLQTEYLDYFIINWPVPRYMENVWQKLNADSWRAMEECVQKGWVREIGVSNFLLLHIETLRKTAQFPIAINQLEIHPDFQQKNVVQYCKKQGIQVQAWSPLFKGKSVQLPVIKDLAEKYGKSPAQIVLRWNIQNGILPIVYSSSIDRMRDNLSVFDFELTPEDMTQIDALETGKHVEAFSYLRQQKSLRGHQI